MLMYTKNITKVRVRDYEVAFFHIRDHGVSTYMMDMCRKIHEDLYEHKFGVAITMSEYVCSLECIKDENYGTMHDFLEGIWNGY